jgi:hypothetical protein
MPARNPIGAAVSAPMRTMIEPNQIGCQPPHHRQSTTIALPIPKKSGTIHAARRNPG